LPGSNLVNWRRPWGRWALDPRVRRFHQRCKRSIAKIFDTIVMTFKSSIKIFDAATDMVFDAAADMIDTSQTYL
jgi:hypothetical protein